MYSSKNNRFNYLLLFVISILSLGSQDHNFYPGLDGSYFWAYNYLLNFMPADLDKITFIYGPLAFLHYTVCYGWLIIAGCIFQILLKFLLGFCIYKLAEFLAIGAKIAISIFVVCCCTMFSPEAYLSLTVILLLMIYYFENKISYIILIAFLTAFGYYYKCSIGLSAFLSQGIFFIYLSILNKKLDLKLLVKFALINLGIWFIIGFILFRSAVPVFESLITYYQNIIAFNETSAFYYGTENFFLLILCGLALIAVFFVNKSKEFKLFWMMALFFLYTGYTHSIVRMDYSHYVGFLLYLLLIIVCTGMFYKTISKYTLPLIIISFFSYYTNIGFKKDYSDFLLSIPNGPRNINAYIFNHQKHRNKCLAQSLANVKVYNSLDRISLNEIKKGKVDFFPWDLSFVEANKLTNWKPRPYLQSLNMSAYFDKKTADYFSSKEAPEHVIWHGGFITDFLYGIDNGYMLTSEFHSVIALFENYEVFKNNGYTLILKKRSHPVTIKIQDLEKEKEVKNSEWIPLPQTPAILGCAIHYDFNMLRGLKKTVYRDDEFFIEYKTASNIKIKKRIWPGDAKDFIWLNPFISSISDSLAYKDIREIRFSNTNPAIHSGNIKLQFKTLQFEGDGNKNAVYKWFNPQHN